MGNSVLCICFQKMRHSYRVSFKYFCIPIQFPTVHAPEGVFSWDFVMLALFHHPGDGAGGRDRAGGGGGIIVQLAITMPRSKQFSIAEKSKIRAWASEAVPFKDIAARLGRNAAACRKVYKQLEALPPNISPPPAKRRPGRPRKTTIHQDEHLKRYITKYHSWASLLLKVTSVKR